MKRSQIEDFKDGKNFIGHEQPLDAEGKVNKSQLWGEHERNFLEDVTINLIPDDEAALGLKAKTHMKWDAKKKRYMLKKVDRDGNIVRDKKNEAGVKIT